MKHIFYFIAICPILWEITVLCNIQKVHIFIINYRKLQNQNEIKINGKKTMFTVLQIFYIGWVFIGFFSFQWIVFLFMFLFGLIAKNNIVLRWFDAFISLTVLIFIILNAYHFKIDIISFILNNIK